MNAISKEIARKPDDIWLVAKNHGGSRQPARVGDKIVIKEGHDLGRMTQGNEGSISLSRQSRRTKDNANPGQVRRVAGVLLRDAGDDNRLGLQSLIPEKVSKSGRDDFRAASCCDG